MKTRTTLTLDEDVAAKLELEVRRTGRSFKEIVNEYLRLGLQAKRPPKTKVRFIVNARSMGLRPSLNYDRVSDLLEQIEGPLAR